MLRILIVIFFQMAALKSSRIQGYHITDVLFINAVQIYYTVCIIISLIHVI